MRWKLMVAALAVTTFLLGGYTGSAGAATGTRNVGPSCCGTVCLNVDRPNLWYRWDTRTGGGVNLTADFGDPDGATNEALALTTNHLESAKAQLYNTQVTGTDLETISALSYNTFHDSDTTGFEDGNVALQLVIDFNGGDQAVGSPPSPTSRTSTACRARRLAAVGDDRGRLVHLAEHRAGTRLHAG